MFRKTKNKKLRHRKYPAFSFIEVMMAIFVIAIGILGTFTPLEKAIIQSHESRNQIAASLLAQEGIELVRNLRDNSAIQGKGSFEKLPATSLANCRVDANSSVLSCGASYKIKLDGSDGLLKHATGTDTRWNRKIEVAYNGTGGNRDAVNTTRVNLIVKVWWGGDAEPATCDSANHCVEARGELGKWLE